MRKNIIKNLLTLLLVVLVFYLVFREDYEKIINTLKNLRVLDIILLIFLSIIFVGLDSLAYYVLVKDDFKGFKFKEAMALMYLGLFGNIATSYSGGIVFQSYYLYKYDISIAKGISTINLNGIFHKLAILLLSIIDIFIFHDYLIEVLGFNIKYFYIVLVIMSVTIVLSILVCTFKRIRDLVLLLIAKIPFKRLDNIKKTISDNLIMIYEESIDYMQNYKLCFKVVFIHIIKLFFLFTVLYICMLISGARDINIFNIYILAIAFHILMNTLPNIAGVGPSEFSYLLVFSPIIGRSIASSSLFIYRLIDYFIPFTIGFIVSLVIKRRIKVKDNLS